MSEPKTARMQIVISPSDIKAIDEWRRSQPDIPSRSEAVRRMVRQVVTHGVSVAPKKKAG